LAIDCQIVPRTTEFRAERGRLRLIHLRLSRLAKLGPTFGGCWSSSAVSSVSVPLCGCLWLSCPARVATCSLVAVPAAGSLSREGAVSHENRCSAIGNQTAGIGTECPNWYRIGRIWQNHAHNLINRHRIWQNHAHNLINRHRMPQLANPPELGGNWPEPRLWRLTATVITNCLRLAQIGMIDRIWQNHAHNLINRHRMPQLANPPELGGNWPEPRLWRLTATVITNCLRLAQIGMIDRIWQNSHQMPQMAQIGMIDRIWQNSHQMPQAPLPGLSACLGAVAFCLCRWLVVVSEDSSRSRSISIRSPDSSRGLPVSRGGPMSVKHIPAASRSSKLGTFASS
jgi:hypothetical protein